MHQFTDRVQVDTPKPQLHSLWKAEANTNGAVIAARFRKSSTKSVRSPHRLGPSQLSEQMAAWWPGAMKCSSMPA